MFQMGSCQEHVTVPTVDHFSLANVETCSKVNRSALRRCVEVFEQIILETRDWL